MIFKYAKNAHHMYVFECREALPDFNENFENSMIQEQFCFLILQSHQNNSQWLAAVKNEAKRSMRQITRYLLQVGSLSGR